MRIADLAFAGQENQYIATWIVVGDFVEDRGDMLGAALLHVAAAARAAGPVVRLAA